MRDQTEELTLSQRCKRAETVFLAGLEENLRKADHRLPGGERRTTKHDDTVRIRGLLSDRGVFDAIRLADMPHDRSLVAHCFVRRFLWWKRKIARIIGCVVSPMEDCIEGASVGRKVDSEQLSEIVRTRIDLRESTEQCIVGVCSTSGFTDEAKRKAPSFPLVQVVLIEPNQAGGWTVQGLGADPADKMIKLFDPEAVEEKIQRIERLIEEREADLITGGVSATSIAKAAQLPESLVAATFRQVAGNDSGRRLTEDGGDPVLFRVAEATERKQSMSLFDRMKSIFGGEGGPQRQIDLLTERRARLTQQRERIYEDISALEEKEQGLRKDWMAAESEIQKRRMIGRISQLRKDMSRQNALAGVLSKQIEVMATDVHNLTLLQQGKAAELPDSEALMDHAVEAEEMLERLTAEADMVGNLAAGAGETLMSDEEAAIQAELEHAAGSEARPSSDADAAAGDTARKARESSKSEPQAE
jgi:hypothetical protein